MIQSDASIGINKYFRNFTPDSNRSHFDGGDGWLLEYVRAGIDRGDVKPGRGEGTVLVSIDPAYVWTPMRPLFEGDTVRATFGARFPGDTPALGGLTVDGPKRRAGSAIVGLYSNSRLVADWKLACEQAREQGKDEPPMSEFVSTDCDWELVFIQGNVGEEEDPQPPIGLARNILGLAGGTPAKAMQEDDVMALRELCRELARGVMFYATHAQAQPQADVW